MVPALRAVTINLCLHIFFSEILTGFWHQAIDDSAKTSSVVRKSSVFLAPVFKPGGNVHAAVFSLGIRVTYEQRR